MRRGWEIRMMGWVVVALIAAGTNPANATKPDRCEACHSSGKWLVQNKKLYDYYQAWEVSVHGHEGVSCVDCHGGDPRATDANSAHSGRGMNAAKKTSAVNFRNIPQTCAACHSDIYQGYKSSSHARQLKGGDQGPTCVTCHGSVNAAALDVTTVGRVCANCHNPKTKNHPEMADRATRVLSRFLSISRLYRYVTLKSDPQSSKAFFERVDPARRALAHEWHTFAMDEVEKKTQTLLEALKRERNKHKKR